MQVFPGECLCAQSYAVIGGVILSVIANVLFFLIVKYVNKKIYLHFFKSDKHLGKNAFSYTQEMSQKFVSRLALLRFFYTQGYLTIKFSQNNHYLDPLLVVCTCSILVNPTSHQSSKL